MIFVGMFDAISPGREGVPELMEDNAGEDRQDKSDSSDCSSQIVPLFPVGVSDPADQVAWTTCKPTPDTVPKFQDHFISAPLVGRPAGLRISGLSSTSTPFDAPQASNQVAGTPGAPEVVHSVWVPTAGGRRAVGRRNAPFRQSDQPGGKASLLDDNESIRFQPALEVGYTSISMTEVKRAALRKCNRGTRPGAQGIGHLLGKKRKDPGLKSRGPNFMNPCPGQDDQDEDRGEPMILGQMSRAAIEIEPSPTPRFFD